MLHRQYFLFHFRRFRSRLKQLIFNSLQLRIQSHLLVPQIILNFNLFLLKFYIFRVNIVNLLPQHVSLLKLLLPKLLIPLRHFLFQLFRLLLLYINRPFILLKVLFLRVKIAQLRNLFTEIRNLILLVKRAVHRHWFIYFRHNFVRKWVSIQQNLNYRFVLPQHVLKRLSRFIVYVVFLQINLSFIHYNLPFAIFYWTWGITRLKPRQCPQSNSRSRPVSLKPTCL